jgi:hypothetical protein
MRCMHDKQSSRALGHWNAPIDFLNACNFSLFPSRGHVVVTLGSRGIQDVGATTSEPISWSATPINQAQLPKSFRRIQSRLPLGFYCFSVRMSNWAWASQRTCGRAVRRQPWSTGRASSLDLCNCQRQRLSKAREPSRAHHSRSVGNKQATACSSCASLVLAWSRLGACVCAARTMARGSEARPSRTARWRAHVRRLNGSPGNVREGTAWPLSGCLGAATPWLQKPACARDVSARSSEKIAKIQVSSLPRRSSPENSVRLLPCVRAWMSEWVSEREREFLGKANKDNCCRNWCRSARIA